MPSAFTHAVAAVAIAAPLGFWGNRRALVVGALAAAAPDLDAAGFALGVPYASVCGHRGFSHSVLAAVLAAVVLAAPPLWRAAGREGRLRLGLFLFLCVVSHGLLDALTNGGLGVAFFAPFSNGRYFFPWTPIQVAPIHPARFFGPRGLAVLGSEVLVVWLPAALLLAASLRIRREALVTTPPKG
jgi:inner membrane protein